MFKFSSSLPGLYLYVKNRYVSTAEKMSSHITLSKELCDNCCVSFEDLIVYSIFVVHQISTIPIFKIEGL